MARPDRQTRTARARRRDRWLVASAVALFVALLAVAERAGREPPRPDELHEVTLAVSGLH